MEGSLERGSKRQQSSFNFSGKIELKKKIKVLSKMNQRNVALNINNILRDTYTLDPEQEILPWEVASKTWLSGIREVENSFENQDDLEAFRLTKDTKILSSGEVIRTSSFFKKYWKKLLIYLVSLDILVLLFFLKYPQATIWEQSFDLTIQETRIISPNTYFFAFLQLEDKATGINTFWFNRKPTISNSIFRIYLNETINLQTKFSRYWARLKFLFLFFYQKILKILKIS